MRDIAQDLLSKLMEKMWYRDACYDGWALEQINTALEKARGQQMHTDTCLYCSLLPRRARHCRYCGRPMDNQEEPRYSRLIKQHDAALKQARIWGYDAGYANGHEDGRNEVLDEEY